jgi:hypothetical protein
MTLRRQPVICSVLFLLGFGSVAYASRPSIERRVLIVDLDRDGRAERVVLDTRQDPSLAVWRENHRLWHGVPRRWEPWKLRTADVDGDGRREIVVGLWKSTRFFPRPHNCLFVYRFDGRTVHPRWLGSALSKPFLDFAFSNLDDDRADELIAVEITRNRKHCLVVYSWSGFGFVADWQRGSWTQARLLETNQGRIMLIADSQRIPLSRKVASANR